MSYRPTTAGHAAQEAPRTIEQETIDSPDSALVALAKEWLGHKGGCSYDHAVEISEGVVTSAWEASYLARHPRLRDHMNWHCLGALISALWNHRCPETTIINPYNMHNHIWIGFKLPANKTLILQGSGGMTWTGNYASGTIIARKGTSRDTGVKARGVFITPSHAYLDESFRGTHIAADECPQGSPFRAYIDALLDPRNDDPVAFEREFGDSITIAKNCKRYTRSREKEARS